MPPATYYSMHTSFREVDMDLPEKENREDKLLSMQILAVGVFYI